MELETTRFGTIRIQADDIITEADVERLQLCEETPKAVLTTVSIPSGNPHAMTANLLAPLVINTESRIGRQVILDDERYHTRHPILQEMWRSLQAAHAAG
jgi:flagellar assembly factor FliW